jgi:hypothetical protein
MTLEAALEPRVAPPNRRLPEALRISEAAVVSLLIPHAGCWRWQVTSGEKISAFPLKYPLLRDLQKSSAQPLENVPSDSQNFRENPVR